MAMNTENGKVHYSSRKLRGTTLIVLVAQEDGVEDRIAHVTSSADDGEVQMAGVVDYLTNGGEEEDAEPA